MGYISAFGILSSPEQLAPNYSKVVAQLSSAARKIDWISIEF